MNIVFFGTPDFVIPVAESILAAPAKLQAPLIRYSLTTIITNPNRPVGRKQIITPTPIKAWAQEHGISVQTPNDLTSISSFTLPASNFNLGILAAYGKIIPQPIIDLFPKGILVIHPSLLPKYRGASPIQTAIMNGEKETGVSIIKMDAKMDHGPIIYQSKSMTKITENDTTGDLTKRLFQEAADVLPEVIENWVNGKIIPQEQDHSQATFTKLLKKEDGFISWNEIEGAVKGERVKEQECKIRAMTPWPGAWTTLAASGEGLVNSNKRLKILKAHVKVLSIKSSVLCLDIIQFEGKKPQPAPSDLF